MTSPTVKLVYGALELNLNDQTEFGVYPDFTPPDIAYTVAFAGGTSANTSGGAELANKAVSNTPFSFRVNVLGSSDADIRKNMGRIRRFLAFAEDQNEPLYLEFNSNSNIPRPLWGQGFFIRYQIAYGTLEYDKGYMVGASLSTDIDAVLNLILQGYPEGLRQRLGSAMGRIVEDVYGASDGVSKGLHVSPSITNKMTNPVFGASTWSTGWTADASLTASQNTNARFVLPGCVNSAKLFSRSTGQEFYQSITLTVATYLFEAIVMLPDFGTPSSSDVELYYNATLTTTFASLGNGLWRLSAFATGQAAPINTGVQVKNGRGIYLLYYGCTDSALSHLPIIGDHLGCAWSGTAHGSTSTSTAGRWRQAVAADTFDYQQGAVRIVWTPNMVYSAYGAGSYRLWDAGSLYINFDATNDRFLLWDGTNGPTVNTTFAADTPIVIHAVWGPSGLYLYVNGVSATTAYTPPAAASYFYLGSDSTPANYCGGVFGDLTVWGVALTATQVANDYANVAQLTADNQRVGCIPWLWTKDGDNVVDNCDDSTRDNWAVCGGIPGSAESITRWNMTTSVEEYLLLANLPLSVGGFARPDANGIGLYVEGSGTAGAASDSNTDYKLTSVTTSSVSIDSTNGMFFDGAAIQAVMRDLYDKEFYVFCRLYDEGSNLTLNLVTRAGTGGDWTSPSWAVTTTAAFRGLLSQIGVVFPSPKFRDLQTFSYLMHLQGKRTTGTANVRVDFVMAIPRPFFVINTSAFDSGTATTYTVSETSHTSSITRTNMTGDVVNLIPEKTNLILSVQYGETLLGTWTNTFARIDVTPRYILL